MPELNEKLNYKFPKEVDKETIDDCSKAVENKSYLLDYILRNRDLTNNIHNVPIVHLHFYNELFSKGLLTEKMILNTLVNIINHLCIQTDELRQRLTSDVNEQLNFRRISQQELDRTMRELARTINEREHF